MADDGTLRPAVVREIESISSNEETSFVLYNMDPPLNEIEMVAIGDAISQSTNVEQVSLYRCLQGSPPAATSTFLKKLLETHPSLRKIYLWNHRLSNDLAEVMGLALKTNTSLQELDLFNNNIGPLGAEALFNGLHHNKLLQTINLGSNHVGDRGATALAGALRVNKTLEKLYLRNIGVRCEGAKSLASALEKSSLKFLVLDNNQLQDEGGKALAISLGKNKSLTRLHLDNNNIGDETCLALAAALRENSTIMQLHLNHNERITTECARAFENTLKHLNYTLEGIYLNNQNVPDNQRDLMYNLCTQNIRVKAFFQQVNQNIPTVPLAVWPRVYETVECKPDLLFALLKTKPEVLRSTAHQLMQTEMS